jgi:hypothetical protein
MTSISGHFQLQLAAINSVSQGHPCIPDLSSSVCGKALSDTRVRLMPWRSSASSVECFADGYGHPQQGGDRPFDIGSPVQWEVTNHVQKHQDAV